jgi:ATP-dependent DNA ligase
MADELSKTYSFLYTPRQWHDAQEAWDTVVTKEGREGLVRKRLSSPTPYPGSDGEKFLKIKQQDFLDARVVGMVSLVRKSGEEDPAMMGALLVRAGKSTFEVGTGFSNFEREWFMKNRDGVIQNDSWIKVKHNPKSEHRTSPHGGVYSGVHAGKTEGVLSELSLDEYTNNDNDFKYAVKASQGWKP